MEIRKLDKSDSQKLEDLIKNVEDNLEDETFWLPITDKSREHFFEESWTYFLGAFDGDELIGAAGLFFNEHEFGESCKALGIKNDNIAQYGRAMIRSDYRNKGIMKQILGNLLEHAKKIGINKIVATVHPKNIPSQKVLTNFKFDNKLKVVKNNRYERYIFLLELLEA
ncbi:MAG: GNAT family N-acetyltransferase [Catonella sp.]|uniref:GNAT family N-acetyltransferase n=1 Tax=Catonella sp. TaxID=2382125 RepID=UPI003F9F817E